MYRAQSMILNRKKHSAICSFFDEWSIAAKEIYNFALFIERQLISSANKTKDNYSDNEIEVRSMVSDTIPDEQMTMCYAKLEKVIRHHRKELYGKNLPNQSIQQCLKMAVHDVQTCFESLKQYKVNPSAFTGKPKLTKYCKSERKTFIMTNQDCVLYEQTDGTYKLKLPYITRQYKIMLDIPYLPDDFKKLKEVRIVPYYDTYKLELVYECKEKERSFNSTKVASIDPGVDNLVTLVTEDESLVINGKVIKSKNQWYNKRAAELNGLLDKMYKTSKHPDSKQLINLWKKRSLWMDNYLHKVSRYIVDYCVEREIGILVLGLNKNWKQECSIGKANTQNFVQIPHSRLYSMIQYKAETEGIKVVLQEESYTSKASYLDNDLIPTYDPESNVKHSFSGKRVKRGLYRASDGTLVNADINGAANIYRKHFEKTLFTLKALQNVRKVTIAG